MNKKTLFILLAAFIIIVIGAKITISVIESGTGVIEKTINPDNVLYNYEWFKQQFEDYNALKQKIEIAEKSIQTFKEDFPPREEWNYSDKNEYSRLRIILDGLEYQKQDVVSKYNARSKMVNRTLFKDNDLPFQLF
jgi:hypothetical protein